MAKKSAVPGGCHVTHGSITDGGVRLRYSCVSGKQGQKTITDALTLASSGGMSVQGGGNFSLFGKQICALNRMRDPSLSAGYTYEVFCREAPASSGALSGMKSRRKARR